MAGTGLFGGYAFDPNVFTDYMKELPTWSNAILASGVWREDPAIMEKLGEKGNVATIPMYTPLDINASNMAPLNNDGATNNTPVATSGKKQACMLIQRMKAWKSTDFTKELTGADPLTNVAESVDDYYGQVWVRELMAIASAAMGVSALSGHVTNLAAASSATPGDANKITQDTLIDAQQAALGDMADGFGLFVIHSKIYAQYKKWGLVDYNKYTIKNALAEDVELPTIGGLIPVVMDRYTVDTTGTNPVYKSYIFGEGAFVGCTKDNYEKPYYVDYDPDTAGGTESLYTKQGRVIHPNGLSFDFTATASESPALTELADSDNYSLVADHKNVKIGLILSNG